jgi:hypothetical protein
LQSLNVNINNTEGVLQFEQTEDVVIEETPDKEIIDFATIVNKTSVVIR